LIVAVAVRHELWQALSFAFGMTWEVLWALILGFALSAIVQAVISKRELQRVLYGLYAVLQLHFAQENESYFSLLDTESEPSVKL